jgi:methionyl-tRNA synthetase
VAEVLGRVARPKRAVVTAGMVYANGPVHIGHLAGAHVPADIHARWLGMLIGRENVLFVCGSDDHGTAPELAAVRQGKPIQEVVATMHDGHERTMQRYAIGLDVYSGTSSPEAFPLQKALSDDLIEKLQAQGLLHKRSSRQWFDPKEKRFLPDRFVLGKCPNPKCENLSAYSDECETCGMQFDPSALIDPRSAISDATPEMRDTVHLWLDMAAVAETLRVWVQGKQDSWRQSVVTTALDKVMPALRFDSEHEAAYKEIKGELPKHKLRYARGGGVELVFANRGDADAAQAALATRNIKAELVTGWGMRSITRDIAWGIPLPGDDPDLKGKTLYVWPDSLLAPISFTRVALAKQGRDPELFKDFWCDPQARIYQFLGQDNVFFYVLMQGAMWLGMQADPHRLPIKGELQLTEILGCFHLLVSGEKMSKSKGNFFTGDQLLEEKGFDADQIRYFLALLGLPDKPSDFDFAQLDARNKFLAGPLNSALERPISAAHSKFGGEVPGGELIDNVEQDTARIVQRYVKAMEKAAYPSMLFEVENYARKINKLFTQHKPHDDRHPEESRRNALYSAFYVLKSLMIMLYPFVPTTMQRLRESLALPEIVFSVDQLGTPIAAGHKLSSMQQFFPAVEGSDAAGEKE